MFQAMPMFGNGAMDLTFSPISARVRGANHKKTGIRCQDNYGIRRLDKMLIIAVADGHGSSDCKYSDIGSEKAVNSFCDIIEKICKSCSDLEQLHALLSRNKDDTIPTKICDEWNRKIERLHKKAHPDEDFDRLLYGSTLLGLAVCDQFVFAAQLGDGDILSVAANGSTDRLIVTERILGTETHSLSSDSAWITMYTTIKYFPAVGETPVLFMLSTDGMANSYATDEAFLLCGKDYADSIQQYGLEEVGKKLKGWLTETTEGGSGDDIAVVLAVSEAIIRA